ncbi:FAD-dependent oxidoreductase [Streptomyces sp. NPDC002994]|uniref:oxidoreductase n=1 Tax=Streptomyces sp. NPDC002994 TaxID=3154441 RepID=UPI0033B01781
MTAYPTLLSPFRIGSVELRNRVVSTSHQTGLVHDHAPTEDLVAYHRARARGGVGAIFLEATAVHPTGLLTPHTIGGYLPQIVPAYRRLTAALHEHDTRLFVQLFHGGREQIASSPKAPAIAPSAVPSPRFTSEPRGLTRAEIRELIDGYAAAARYAHQGGVDGLEISMAHGYLPAQFFTPGTNRREDEYGPDGENRLRFALQVLEAVRERSAGAMAVGVRLAADEMAPGALNADGCAEIATALRRSGLVDFVSFAMGRSDSYAASTYIAPPPPAPLNAIAEPVRRMRSALPGCPLIATTRVVDVTAAEELVASGAADLVGMTRALIADPELIAKNAPGEAYGDGPRGGGSGVIECIGCNQGCIGHYHAGVPIACTVNPRTGRERHLTPLTLLPSRPARRVLVVGAGPAGLAAALEAAGAGDEVVVAERQDAIGGQLRIAGHAPAHHETWERYLRSTGDRLKRANVDLRLSTTVTAADTGHYDLVVVATGARPFTPELPGLSCHAMQAWDAIQRPEVVRGPVLVADWGGGWTGLDAAETLARAGLPVTLACAAVTPGETLHQYQRNLYLARLDRLGVPILHHTELTAAADGDNNMTVLRHVFSGRTQPLPDIETLVLAQGRVPDDALWQSLEGRPRYLRAGDVLGPRSAEEAILEGTLAARGEPSDT